jgi:hypothetical protein
MTPFFTGYPDLSIPIEFTVVEGDKIAVRLKAPGTHNGDFRGIALPGSGQALWVSQLPALLGARSLKCGASRTHWAYCNSSALFPPWDGSKGIPTDNTLQLQDFLWLL